jgi:hypothetical protein
VTVPEVGTASVSAKSGTRPFAVHVHDVNWLGVEIRAPEPGGNSPIPAVSQPNGVVGRAVEVGAEDDGVGLSRKGGEAERGAEADGGCAEGGADGAAVVLPHGGPPCRRACARPMLRFWQASDVPPRPVNASGQPFRRQARAARTPGSRRPRRVTEPIGALVSENPRREIPTRGEHTVPRIFRITLLAALVLALAIGVAACGDDDDDAAEATTDGAELVLTGESTTLALDEATAGVLTDNGVEVAPVDPATAGDEGIAFPITGGTVEAESLAGTIEHSGGLVFSAGGTELEVTDFVIDTTDGVLTATAGGDQIPLLAVDLTALERSDDSGTIVLEGIATSLSAEAAIALNDTFGVDIFEEGIPIGTVTVRATA